MHKVGHSVMNTQSVASPQQSNINFKAIVCEPNTLEMLGAAHLTFTTFKVTFLCSNLH